MIQLGVHIVSIMNAANTPIGMMCTVITMIMNAITIVKMSQKMRMLSRVENSGIMTMKVIQ